MGIKLKFVKEGQKEQTAEVRDEIQAAAFLKAGFIPATKADEAKLKGEDVEDDK